MPAMLKLLQRKAPTPAPVAVEPAPSPADSAVPVARVAYRTRCRVAGRVRSMRIQPWSGAATLECTVVDQTGGIVVVFLGRRRVAGIDVGTRLVVEGMVGAHNGRLAMLNPDYWIVP